MDLKGFDIRAAIFDLDGTIADSLDVWSDIDKIFFAEHGMAEPADYQLNVQSMNFKEAAAYTKDLFSFPESEEAIIKRWHDMSVHEYADKIELKPKAREFIELLYRNGVKLGLATASGNELFEPLLKRCGVYSFFNTFTTTIEAGKDKNSPDVYLLCAKKLGVCPEKCIVFEDILPGISSAKKAGMKACGVYDRHSNKDAELIKKESDIYISGFESFLNNLK